MNQCVIGAKSKIGLSYADKYHHNIDRVISFNDACDHLFHDSYVICTGYLEGEPIGSIHANPSKTFEINYIKIAAWLDCVLDHNNNVRICVIGSMSGINGSYDMAYAGAKAAMHLYVKTKRLGRKQHLTCVAPTIVWDTNMTQSREDINDLKERGLERKNKKWLYSHEVAETVRTAINYDCFCNQVVEMR